MFKNISFCFVVAIFLTFSVDFLGSKLTHTGYCERNFQGLKIYGTGVIDE